MSNLNGRLHKLERQYAREAEAAEERTLTAPEIAERRALERASYSEKLELWRYHEAEDEAAYLKLWEEVLHREAPTLAADVRVHRDLLWRELSALEEQWDEEGRRHSTSYSDPAYWNLRNAEVNRMHALQLGLTEVIEDEAEVMRIIETVINPDTTVTEIWHIVDRT